MASQASTNPEAAAKDDDIRPLVGEDRGNRPLWMGIGAILFAGLLLFGLLESRRERATAPAVRPRAADLAALSNSGPPPLYLPPEPITQDSTAQLLNAIPLTPAVPVTPVIRVPAPQPSPAPFQNRPDLFTPQPPALPGGTNTTNGPAVVFDATGPDASNSATAGAGSTPDAPGLTTSATRARASRVINPATVVPQGTLIAAVLETALDSTQPGQARALVSRDVINLHGSRVLIPRGSRLFGNYRGDLSAGQNRAQVEWTRLVRPDGVTIAIDSPAADRLGRAGIRGRVNTHFLERLSGALLQSSIEIGTSVAARSVSNDSVIIALPGSVQGATSQLVGTPPKPTLRIKQGTRISVFVVRDLDFTAVEARR
jgi:type IV secretion system protein VirB10